MLHNTIKQYRKAKGLSQEEVAVQLNIVRQTVSKWEKGLSVPDADMLIRLAEVLDVSVNQLLDMDSADRLSDELASVNTQLAEMIEAQRTQRLADKKREKILGLTFLSMLSALIIQNPLVSIFLTLGSLAAAAAILYRNLALLTSGDVPLKRLRIATYINAGFLLVGLLLIILIAADILTLSEQAEKAVVAAFISCFMLFAGCISPGLPFNRHTGLRLPWTIQDEEAWNVAHRILGIISVPMVFLYIACACTLPDFGTVTLCTMAVWIGIPGGLSYLVFLKKYMR